MPGDCSQYRSSASAAGGMTLLLTLLLLGLLVTLVIQGQITARLMLKRAENQAWRAQLRAAALDAAWAALDRLAADTDLQVDHLGEDWAQPEECLLPNGIITRTRIEDATACFNINNLAVKLPLSFQRQPRDVVAELLKMAQQLDPARQARALQDWIEADPTAPAGAPAGSDQTPLATSGRPMESPGEIVYVLAQTGSAEPALPSGLTVLPTPRGDIAPRSNVLTTINLNTAETNVILAVLGQQNTSAARALCITREAAPLVSLTPLNQLLKTSADNPWQGYFDVKSSYFMVISSAEHNQATAGICAWVYRDPQGQIEILRWLAP